MKGKNFLVSTTGVVKASATGFHKAAVVLGALLLGVCGTGRTVTAQAQTGGSEMSVQAADRGQGNVWLRIIAFTDAPVAGADVRVSVHGSQGRPLVAVHAATNRYGAFAAAVPKHPSSFRVSISGGTIDGNSFVGHLSSDIVLTDPAHQIVVVNPVTTLVSLVMDARPNLKLDGAEARVRSFLGLPANYSLGMALRESSHYASRRFSPIALLTEAQAAGGLDAFEHLLAQELLASPGATHSFHNSKPKAPGDGTTSFEEDLALAALQAAGGQGAGWVMAQTGLVTPGITSAEIDALIQELSDLQSSIDALSKEVAALENVVISTATLTQYTVDTADAEPYAAQITSDEQNLQFYASQCPPLAPDSPPPSNQSWCQANYQDEVGQLQGEFDNAYYEKVLGYIQDTSNPPSKGMLHLYSLYLFETKPLFRAADSTTMQNLHDYWDTIVTSAANLRMEWFHFIGDQNSSSGQLQLTDFMGNPDLSPPTTGVFQANEATNQSLILSPVPDGTVVSTVDFTMWSLVPWAYNGKSKQFPFPVYLYPQASCSAIYPEPGPLATYQEGYAGFSDWLQVPPSQSTWQNLVKPAPSLSSGSDWQDWLIQETQTTSSDTSAGATSSPGFFNMAACGYGAWSSTFNGPDSYAVFYPNQDSFSFLSGLDFNEFLWPTRSLATGEQYFWTN